MPRSVQRTTSMTQTMPNSCGECPADDLRPLVVCDAGHWLRRMRLPADTLTVLLQMATGDDVVLFEFDGPALISGGSVGVGRARILCASNEQLDAARTGGWVSKLGTFHAGDDERAFNPGDANVIRVGKKLAGRSLDAIVHDAFPRPQ